ncbi:MAG: DUF1045 domain-containing protein [Rhodospirillales bacterium]
MTARYAIYFVPPEDHPVYAFGQHLLGRDAHLCGPLAQPALAGIAPVRLEEITAEPRDYGFHATLKPPFCVKDGTGGPEALHDAAAGFAARRTPFTVRHWKIRALDRFIAIMPVDAPKTLQILADDCVRDFEPFRAPATEDERAKRRAPGLTPRQEAFLDDWGYPYVFEEFRLHLTLTGRIEGETERKTVLDAIRKICPPECLTDIPVNAISIFGQPDTWMPFHQTKRFPFGG